MKSDKAEKALIGFIFSSIKSYKILLNDINEVNHPYAKKGGGGNKLRSWCKECDAEYRKGANAVKKTAPPPEDNQCCEICGCSAEELNETLKGTVIADLLSDFGTRFFFIV